jgi:putative endonuclease
MYVYVLKSKKDRLLYTGCTSDLRERLKKHNNGQVPSTKLRVPLELIYYEFCVDKTDAFHREKYLKTTYGKRYIKSRLKNYFTG